jgi:osmotically-inducible protein OsmY
MANERWRDYGPRRWDEGRWSEERAGFGGSGWDYDPRINPDYAGSAPWRGSGYGQYREDFRHPYRGGDQWGYEPRYGGDYGYGWSPREDRARGSDYLSRPQYSSGPDYGRYNERGQYAGWGPDRPLWDRTRDELRSWIGDENAERRRVMDSRAQSGHYGRGPRGYTRSEDRIREDVSDRLTDDWEVDASNIEVLVSSGEVTLNGTVDSRYAKRRAEHLADQVSGVRHVQNNLRVQLESTSQVGSAGSGETAEGTTASTRGRH